MRTIFETPYYEVLKLDYKAATIHFLSAFPEAARNITQLRIKRRRKVIISSCGEFKSKILLSFMSEVICFLCVQNVI